MGRLTILAGRSIIVNIDSFKDFFINKIAFFSGLSLLICLQTGMNEPFYVSYIWIGITKAVEYPPNTNP